MPPKGASSGKIDHRLGYCIALVSIGANLVLFGLKLWAGLSTGSVAAIADAWHTLSDSFTSAVVIMGFIVSSKPADTRHPFGHGRLEIISSVIIGTVLAVVAFNVFVGSVQRLSQQQGASYSLLVIVVFSLSVVVKEAMAQVSSRAGKKIGSPALVADAWHHRTDAIASLLIVVGYFLGRMFWWIDGVLGILVALLILYATYEILKGSISALIGEEPGPELKSRVQNLASRVTPGKINVHHLHLHRYGDHWELTFHIFMRHDMSISRAHEIANELEELIKEDLGIEATTHVDPIETT